MAVALAAAKRVLLTMLAMMVGMVAAAAAAAVILPSSYKAGYLLAFWFKLKPHGVDRIHIPNK